MLGPRGRHRAFTPAARSTESASTLLEVRQIRCENPAARLVRVAISPPSSGAVPRARRQTAVVGRFWTVDAAVPTPRRSC